MPAYQTNPAYQRKALNPGQIAYSFGSFNDRTPPTRLGVSSVAIASNVATLGVKLLDGNIPVVGALLTAQGIPTAAGAISAVVPHSGAAGSGFNNGDQLAVTGGGGTGAVIAVATNSGGAPLTYSIVSPGSGYTTGTAIALTVLTGSGTAGTGDITAGTGANFNVSGIALTAVSINSTTGVGTVSFALTGTNQATTTTSGLAIVPQPIVGDSVSSGSKGEQRAIPSYMAGNRQHGLSWFTSIGGSPSGVAIWLQVADVDVDSEYTTVDASTNVAGETRSVGNITANFVRVIAQTITGGTSPTLAAGLLLS